MCSEQCLPRSKRPGSSRPVELAACICVASPLSAPASPQPFRLQASDRPVDRLGPGPQVCTWIHTFEAACSPVSGCLSMGHLSRAHLSPQNPTRVAPAGSSFNSTATCWSTCSPTQVRPRDQQNRPEHTPPLHPTITGHTHLWHFQGTYLLSPSLPILHR